LTLLLLIVGRHSLSMAESWITLRRRSSSTRNNGQAFLRKALSSACVAYDAMRLKKDGYDRERVSKG
jgi:hypothetical protein